MRMGGTVDLRLDYQHYRPTPATQSEGQQVSLEISQLAQEHFSNQRNIQETPEVCLKCSILVIGIGLTVLLTSIYFRYNNKYLEIT